MYDIQFSFGKFHPTIMAFDLAANHIRNAFLIWFAAKSKAMIVG